MYVGAALVVTYGRDPASSDVRVDLSRVVDPYCVQYTY